MTTPPDHSQIVDIAATYGWRATFTLERDTDVSGISGTGTIADGVLFPDGTVSMRWRGKHKSTVQWPSIDDVLAVHGHGGATRIIWDLTLTDRACDLIDAQRADIDDLNAQITELQATLDRAELHVRIADLNAEIDELQAALDNAELQPTTRTIVDSNNQKTVPSPPSGLADTYTALTALWDRFVRILDLKPTP